MKPSHIFRTSLRAALVALAVGGTALVAAAPAEAASPSFSFQIGGGPNGYHPHPGGSFFFRFGDQDHSRYCLTDYQLRDQLRRQGYRDVRFVREGYSDNSVWAVALKHGRWVQFRVDRCTGHVDHVRYVQRSPNGNFNLSFTF